MRIRAREPFDWILRTQRVIDECDEWECVAASFEDIDPPVCAENTSDMQLYIETLQFWHVPWKDTPAAFLLQIAGAPDNDGDVLRSLSLAEKEAPDDAKRVFVSRLVKMREYYSSIHSESKDVANSILDTLAKNACPDKQDIVDFVPWLTSAITGAELDELIAHVDNKPNVLRCPPLFRWLASRIAKKDATAGQQMMQSLLTLVLRGGSMDGWRALLHEGGGSSGANKQLLKAALRNVQFDTWGHNCSAKMFEALEQFDSSLFSHKGFVTTMLSKFCYSPNQPDSIDGVVHLAQRIADAPTYYRFGSMEMMDIVDASFRCQNELLLPPWQKFSYHNVKHHSSYDERTTAGNLWHAKLKFRNAMFMLADRALRAPHDADYVRRMIYSSMEPHPTMHH